MANRVLDKQTLLELRKALKGWETSFKAKHCRSPSRSDSQQDGHIYELYIKYRRHKAALQKAQAYLESSDVEGKRASKLLKDRRPSGDEQAHAAAGTILLRPPQLSHECLLDVEASLSCWSLALSQSQAGGSSPEEGSAETHVSNTPDLAGAKKEAVRYFGSMSPATQEATSSFKEPAAEHDESVGWTRGGTAAGPPRGARRALVMTDGLDQRPDVEPMAPGEGEQEPACLGPSVLRGPPVEHDGRIWYGSPMEEEESRHQGLATTSVLQGSTTDCSLGAQQSLASWPSESAEPLDFSIVVQRPGTAGYCVANAGPLQSGGCLARMAGVAPSLDASEQDARGIKLLSGIRTAETPPGTAEQAPASLDTIKYPQHPWEIALQGMLGPDAEPAHGEQVLFTTIQMAGQVSLMCNESSTKGRIADGVPCARKLPEVGPVSHATGHAQQKRVPRAGTSDIQANVPADEEKGGARVQEPSSDTNAARGAGVDEARGAEMKEDTWADPRALRKEPRARKGKGREPASAGHPMRRRSAPPVGRDNFMRNNLRGGSGRFRKGARPKRKGSYVAQRPRKVGNKRQKGERGCLGGKQGEGEGAGEGASARYCGKGLFVDGHLQGAELEDAEDAQLEARAEGSCRRHGAGDILEKHSELARLALADPCEANLSRVLQEVFGFEAFREGQLAAIQRTLAGESTLLVLPTGAGKSLCYQVPAFLMEGVTVVVSPLVALMEDQLKHLPAVLPAALLKASQDRRKHDEVIQRLRDGDLKVLFVSPERLFVESFMAVLVALPRVPLVVIDEAHCISEWSHNFRTVYLRLGHVLWEKLQVRAVLALTATATRRTEASVSKTLRLAPDGVIRAACTRANLLLSVSRTTSSRLRDLLDLLRQPPFKAAPSIIVYSNTKAEVEMVARALSEGGIAAEAYHAGMEDARRSKVQDRFNTNKLRTIVATVAFGMGLDKPDVRAVVHFGLPRSIEQYVQETGRAGRDGQPAFCHLFLDDGEYIKQRSLARSEGVDEHAVHEFLTRVFCGSGASGVTRQSARHQVQEAGNELDGEGAAPMGAVVVEAAEGELDIKEQVMDTILAFLETEEDPWLRVLPRVHATCELSFHKRPAGQLAESNALVKQVVRGGRSKGGHLVANIVDLARGLGKPLAAIERELRSLEARGEIKAEFRDRAFCFQLLRAPGSLPDLATHMAARLCAVEQLKEERLDAMYAAAAAAADMSQEQSSSQTLPSGRTASCSGLEAAIAAYFEASDQSACQSMPVPRPVQQSGKLLGADIKVFLKMAPDAQLTGRVIARVLHGLQSPAFPASIWSKNPFWGRHVGVDFMAVRDLAHKELLGARQRQ